LVFASIFLTLEYNFFWMQYREMQMKRRAKPKGEFTDKLGRTHIRCSNCNGFAPKGDTLCGTCVRKSQTKRSRREQGLLVDQEDRDRLISAIMQVNNSLSKSQAVELARTIENHGKQAVLSGANLDERAAACGEYKLTFGQWSGCKLKDVSPDYIIWLAGVVEERRHSIDFLNAIRAARAIKLSWEPRLPENTDVPFDY